jgi:predicted CoA-substrate-specific enzyme activase
MPYLAGIDCGTSFTKAVVLLADDGQPRVLGKGRTRSGVKVEEAATTALSEALAQAGVQRSAIDYIATTGFGRYGVGFRDIQLTEITTAARGAHFAVPNTTAILDIGGQCTRAIGITDTGKVKAFKSNDKCAAGSGMFIQRAAKYLEVPLEAVGELSLQATHPQPISSVCAVLAESEIINHVSAGITVQDILRGIHESLADRAGTLLKRVEMKDQLTLIGGVARQAGIAKAIQDRLKVGVNIPSDCDFICALGAALLGLKRLQNKRSLREAVVTSNAN